MRIWPGESYPLGATWDGIGINFALFSDHATGVDLCLFDADGTQIHRIAVTGRTADVWHVYLPDVAPGQLYGYRVYGPFAPEQGHRFDPDKLLIDPYALAISGRIETSATLASSPSADESDGEMDRDTAGELPKCVVVDGSFTWQGDLAPKTPWSRTVIYECHVKGMTMLNPGVAPELRGTYLGMASDAVIQHLLKLGVTAVELLPVHHFVDEGHLVANGLTNYWGYNSIGFFAPAARYATAQLGGQVDEFKSMVKSLHSWGIEVILDVVYNHTGEGNHLGPTVSFRGIDNVSYYHLRPEDLSRYRDYAGTGNSLSLRHPRALQMVIDSLRYWVTEMHIDGFRFDLAPTLGREVHLFDARAAFFKVLQQDPVLQRVKLIAEAWDLGEGGYQVGNFPPDWSEWNDRYRDCIRSYWRGDKGQVPELASRLSGSSDIFERSGRGPRASVNFITSHDGFTLADLVSYSHKHNEANLEHNHDGAHDNISHNWGEEGPTGNERVARMRARILRNLMSTLLFSQGVPMIVAGDEMGRTQGGNNNAYCQDNEISWVNWDLSPSQQQLLEFTVQVMQVLKDNPVLRRRKYFTPSSATETEVPSVVWLRPDGSSMQTPDWDNADNHVLGMLMPAGSADEVDATGHAIAGDTLLLLLNSGTRSTYFALPEPGTPGRWRELINTARPGTKVRRRQGLNLTAHSLILLGHGPDL
ncbi:MAG: glycogen debranching protein GlgX [Actinomycetota bacterium]